jgi:PIN domain nuclease of toxin-antitoxin system
MRPHTAVLDASALLAWLQGEQGADLVEPHIEHGAISAVNWTEVLQRVLRHRAPSAQRLRPSVEALGLEILEFTVEDAQIAAVLHARTFAAGLSLGDRACLALAHRLDVPAVTADTAWKNLTVLGIPILSIR